MDIPAFLSTVQGWCEQEAPILGALLIGSYAKGTATVASDIDLVLITHTPSDYLTDTSWLRKLGDVQSHTIEYWGLLTALRVFFTNGMEVEFGFAAPNWIHDKDTLRILKDGHRILYNPHNILDSFEKID